jgi:acyl-coenzyme A thioesterase PaaI-like protein
MHKEAGRYHSLKDSAVMRLFDYAIALAGERRHAHVSQATLRCSVSYVDPAPLRAENCSKNRPSSRILHPLQGSGE